MILQSLAGATALVAQATTSAESWVGYGATGLCVVTLITLLKNSEDARERVRVEAAADRQRFLEAVNSQTAAVTKLAERLDVVDQMKELLDDRMPSRDFHLRKDDH